MSEAVAQIEATWASDDRTALEIALAALPKNGTAHTPIVLVEWGGRTSYASRVSSTIGAITLPVGIREEVTPVAGVFMQGPRKPTVLEWMDRLHEDRQADLLDALQTTKDTRRFYARMLGAGEIDPRHPDTIAGVQLLANAGVLTPEEAAALLA